MILYDPAALVHYRDYGIMLPIPPDRGKQALDFLNAHGMCGAFPILDINTAQSRLGLKGPALGRKDLERVHSVKYTGELYGEGLQTALLNTFELIDARGRPNRYEPDRAIRPLSDMFQTLIAQAGGTYLACLLALAGDDLPNAVWQNAASMPRNFCYYLGGGMHHARYDAGSGFCLINDVAAAALKIPAEKPVRLLWIIDLDAHKGDGTAELIHYARQRGELYMPDERSPYTEYTGGKPCILTLSIHMAKGWPLDTESLAAAEAGRAPLLPSDVDIGIDSGEEACYTARLAEGIRQLERLSGKTPDMALVVDGADPYEHDGLPSTGLLHLTLEQCLERDICVYRYLQDRRIPSAWIQAGGYGDRAWEPPAHFLRMLFQPKTSA